MNKLGNNHPLDDVQPLFLKSIDKDPKGAAREFYTFLCRLLASMPPQRFSTADPETRKDLTMQIALHCIRDSFRVLRTYRPMRRPFAVWLRQVAANQITDYFRADRQLTTNEDFSEVAGGGSSGVGLSDERELLVMVCTSMSEMDRYCQLLLQMAADEYLPREMALALRWPAHRSKKISDDLRYCRKKLLNLLSSKGIQRELSI